MKRPEVRISQGKLRGNWESGVAVFRGIPFAEPPVGALRFAAPRPVESWDGVHDAVEFGPPPPQAAAFGMNARNAGEDWLTLNVFTPDLGANLPVMVWIQGGAYAIGMSSLPEYDGGHLARDGVVVVTFNYRVGIEGFAQLDGAPANRGLLDQIAALEWVRESIRALGGNPDRVTVFGQSAGGGSVAALLAMRTAGLFQRAIAQSVPGIFFTPALADSIAAKCAAELGLRPTVADLSTVDPARLVAAGDAVTARMGPHRKIPFAPVVDGEVLPAAPWQALADGAARDIELIVGHTRDEQRLFTVIEDAAIEIPPAYREGFPDASPDELAELVNSDWLFRMPSLHLAEAQAAGGGRVHVYELTWSGVLGACHGLDVPLVFGNLDRGQPSMLIDSPEEAAELSARMRAAWTSFAIHGDPGWPAYDPRQRLVRLFDAEPVVTTYPEEVSRQIWRDHTFSALESVT